jgi:predicted DNA-binding ribbon-helix-helix protein
MPLRGSPIFLLYRFHTGESHFMKGQRKSSIIKRSITFEGRKTSVSLEAEFWDALKEIAGKQSTSVGALVATINKAREHPNLSSGLRLFVLDHYRAQADARRSAEGPNEKGHPVRSGRP